MKENNYFLSWQLSAMSLSWLCVILVGCSEEVRKRVIFTDIKEQISVVASLNEQFCESQTLSLFLHSHLQSPCCAFEEIIFQATPSRGYF